MSIGPYGYTLTVWTSGAVLTHARGVPTGADALLFMLGGVGGFALVGIIAFGDLRARIRIDSQPPAVWGGLHIISVGASIVGVTVVADRVANTAAWPLGGFSATVLYLGLLAAQLALAG
ncbi:MAG: hypothetical protein ACRDU4_12475 [Mycobacterium sp.]